MPLQKLRHLAPLSIADPVLALIVAATIFRIMECAKALRREPLGNGA